MAAELELNDTRVEFIADYVLKTMKVKSDKWSKMYNVDETKQLFMDYFEKADITTLIIVVTPAGALAVQYEWPPNPKGKACYFVKKTKDPINKDTPFRTAIVYGDLSTSPLDQLSAFVDEVSLCFYKVNLLLGCFVLSSFCCNNTPLQSQWVVSLQ